MPFVSTEAVIKPFLIFANPSLDVEVKTKGRRAAMNTEEAYRFLIEQNLMLKNIYSFVSIDAQEANFSTSEFGKLTDIDVKDGKFVVFTMNDKGEKKFFSFKKDKSYKYFSNNKSVKVGLNALTDGVYYSLIEPDKVSSLEPDAIPDAAGLASIVANAIRASVQGGSMLVHYAPRTYPGDHKGNFVYIEFTRHNYEPAKVVVQKPIKEVEKDLYEAIWIINIREVGHPKQRAMMQNTESLMKDISLVTDQEDTEDTEGESKPTPEYPAIPYHLHKRMNFTVCFSRTNSVPESFKHGNTTYQCSYFPIQEIERMVSNVTITEEGQFNRQIDKSNYASAMTVLLLNRYFASIARHNYNDSWLKLYIELIFGSGHSEVIDYFKEVMRAIIMVTESDLAELMLRILYSRFCARYYIHTDKDATNPVSFYVPREIPVEPIEVSTMCPEQLSKQSSE